MAKKTKVSFLFYYDYLDQFKELTTEEIIELIKNMTLYDRDGIDPEYQDRTLRSIWNFIKRRMDIDKDNYLKTCVRNKKNVEKRYNKGTTEATSGKSGKENLPNATKTTSGKSGKENLPHATTSTDIDKDTHIDIDNNSVCIKKEEEKSVENFYCQLKRTTKIEACEKCMKNQICPIKTDPTFRLEKGCSFEEWLAKKQELAERIINTPHDPPNEESKRIMEELKDYNWLEELND